MRAFLRWLQRLRGDGPQALANAKRPPFQLDGAHVLHWAWSSPAPFFVMGVTSAPGEPAHEGIPIHGLAICRYADSRGQVYVFSCDAQWEVQNDAPYESVAAARARRSLQYDTSKVIWRASTDSGPRTDA